MPEIKQYTFKHKEVVELMIRHLGLHEGKWMLMANFGFSAANLGPTGDEMSPGAATVLNHIGITRATDSSPPSLTVDAAKVNPTTTTRRKRRRA